ncbi:hypothetical protein GF377_06525 [candidate division GN15 bacterium]|nr:hypothetical protein [candidate division GN15 bacterium]
MPTRRNWIRSRTFWPSSRKMRAIISTSKLGYFVFNLSVLLLAAMVIGGCQGPAHRGVETPPAEEPATVDSRGFDPLELPQDREVVPELYPREGTIRGSQVLVEAQPTETVSDTAMVTVEVPPTEIDSLNGQAYRIQLFTSKLYGDAKEAVRVAEEIFDRPVYLDYEVPYFKVRVGSFASRDAAEDYQTRAKAAGYSDAWVVMVNLGVKEVAPVYNDMGPLPSDSYPADTAGGSQPGQVAPSDGGAGPQDTNGSSGSSMPDDVEP